MDLPETEVELSWAGVSCAPRGMFLRPLNVNVPMCRAVLGPEAAELKAGLKERLSSFMVGDVLIAVDNLVLSNFWLFGGFLGVRATTFFICFGEKKKMEKYVSEKKN